MDLSQVVETLRKMKRLLGSLQVLTDAESAALNVAIDALTVLGNPGFQEGLNWTPRVSRSANGRLWWVCLSDAYRTANGHHLFAGATLEEAFHKAAAAIRAQEAKGDGT